MHSVQIKQYSAGRNEGGKEKKGVKKESSGEITRRKWNGRGRREECKEKNVRETLERTER